MTAAAFQLTPLESQCGYPGCIAEAFHEGQHVFRDKRTEFSVEKFIDEDNERLANLVTSYGVGTRSYNRSAEKRELDRQLAVAKAQYAAHSHEVVVLPLMCVCPQRSYPHELSVHTLIRSESYNPKRRFVWPWSLCLSDRRELSTDR